MRLLLVPFMLLVGGADSVSVPEEAASRLGSASTVDLTGEWDVRFAASIRHNRDGSVEVQNWDDALMVFTQDRDSVTGSWTRTVKERVTWTFEGTLKAGHVRLLSIGHDSDNPELDVLEGIVWDATLTGDRLDGYVELHLRGRAREPARRPWSAVRRGG